MFTSISISRKQGNDISKTTSGDNISKAITTEKNSKGLSFIKNTKRPLSVQGSLVRKASGDKQAAGVGGERL